MRQMLENLFGAEVGKGRGPTSDSTGSPVSYRFKWTSGLYSIDDVHKDTDLQGCISAVIFVHHRRMCVYMCVYIHTHSI